MGSSVYVIFLLINPFPFSPKARPDYPDDLTPIGEAHSKDYPVHFP